LSSALSSLRSAWLFFAFWAGFALLPLGFAWYLTKKIVYVNRSDFDYKKTPMQEIGIFTHGKTKHRWIASVDYKDDDGSRGSSIELWAGEMEGAEAVEILLNNVKGSDACTDADSNKGAPSLQLFAVQNFERPAVKDAYLINWKPVQVTVGDLLHKPHNLSIKCKLKSIVERQTYTQRRINFSNTFSEWAFVTPQGRIPGQEPELEIGEPIKWTLSLSGAGLESITFASRNHEAGSEDLVAAPTRGDWGMTRVFAPGEIVEVRWESLASESRRDIYIVIIGALVALGAAMVLESIRPFVERLIAAHEPLAVIPTEPVPSPLPEAPPTNALDSSSPQSQQSPAEQTPPQAPKS
jgi:hypothetical protein